MNRLTIKFSILFIALILSIGFFSACNNTRQSAEEQSPKNVIFSNVVSPAWAKNATIYEVNIRQFSEEGSFNAFSEHLDRLHELGVDILWIMPIHPIGEIKRKGGLGSYYSVKDYTAINPEFGTLDDFKNLVSKAHEKGFKVIIDWVANHTAFDHAWTSTNPEWYKRDEHNEIISPYDWTDVAALEYESNPDLWDTMIGEMKFWLNETNIDGFRCDVAGMVPTAFWDQARMELDAIKPVFMLAEDEAQVDLTQKAFDANYGWEMHHIMNSIAKGTKDVNDIWNYFRKEDTVFAPSVFRMMFTSNHDENSWNGTVFERLGAAVKTFAVMSYTIPGFPLIYNGQEVGLSHRLEFFEKDQIIWKDTDGYTEFYTRLNQIKKSNESLWNADSGGKLVPVETNCPESVLSFIRQKGNNQVLVLLNLSSNVQQLRIDNTELFGTYTDLISEEQFTIENGQALQMEAWTYYILQ